VLGGTFVRRTALRHGWGVSLGFLGGLTGQTGTRAEPWLTTAAAARLGRQGTKRHGHRLQARPGGLARAWATYEPKM